MGFLGTALRIGAGVATGGLSEVGRAGYKYATGGGEAPQSSDYLSNAWDTEELTPEQEQQLQALAAKLPPGYREKAIRASRSALQKQNFEQRAQKEREMRVGIQQQMQDRYKQLSGPMNPNDPGVAQGLTSATNAASRDAALRGVGGPMSVANTQQAYAQAWNGMDMQRQQQANQMLGALGGFSLDRYGIESKVAADQRNFDYGRFQDAANAYAADKSARMGLFTGLLGGGAALAATGDPTTAAKVGQGSAGLGGGAANGYYGGKVGY